MAAPGGVLTALHRTTQTAEDASSSGSGAVEQGRHLVTGDVLEASHLLIPIRQPDGVVQNAV